MFLLLYRDKAIGVYSCMHNAELARKFLLSDDTRFYSEYVEIRKIEYDTVFGVTCKILDNLLREQ